MMNPSHPLHDSRRRRVAVVGAGALGSELCRLIALSNTLAVTIIDHDTLEPRNLFHSSMLQIGSDSLIGNDLSHHSKGAMVVAAAKRSFAQPDWNFLPVAIADASLAALAECALVYSCTDNTLARCETSYVSRVLGKDMIDGGVTRDGAQAGRVACYPPERAAACYLCHLSETRRAEILSFLASTSLGCMRMPAPTPMDAPRSMIAVIAQQMFDAGIKLLREQSAGRSMSEATVDQFSRSSTRDDIVVETMKLPLSPTCPWHSAELGAHLAPLDVGVPIRLLLHSEARDGQEQVLDLHWPICLAACCTHCHELSRPMRRVGWVRSMGACESCGCVGMLEPREVAQSVSQSHPVASLSLQQLGFAAGDLFRVRPRYSLRSASAQAG